jgi:hypothetical protein
VAGSSEHGNEPPGSMKVKVKLSPYLTKHHAMKTYSLTLALDADEWSASCPRRFNLRERVPGSH